MTTSQWRQRAWDTLYVWRKLMPMLQEHRSRLWMAFGMTVVVVLAELAKPWPIKFVIDYVLGDRPSNLLPLDPTAMSDNDKLSLAVWSALAVLVFAVISGIGTYFRELWLAESGQKIVNRVRKNVLSHMLDMSLFWHEQRRRGDLLLRLIADSNSLRMLLVSGLFALMREGLLLVGTLVVLFVLDWRIGLATLAVLPAIGVMSALFSVRLRRAARKQRLKEGELATSVHETLSAVPVIQAYGLEQEATRAFARANRKSGKAGLQAVRIEGRLNAGAETALALGIGFALFIGAQRALVGALTPGELLVVISYVRGFYKPIKKAMGRSAAMMKASAAGERVLELLDSVTDLTPPSDPVDLPEIRGRIDLEDVSFHHGGGRQILRGASLTLQPGEHVALLGDNGAGKTTLATLLPRMRDPQHGTVRLDGVDVRRIDLSRLRRSIAMVFQETVLFHGTLRENIQMGAPEASAEAVEAAARRAGVTTYSDRWPDGLDTAVGEGGATLSGGERQRVALARALLRDAHVVILDEPSTGLDAASEARLGNETLDSLRGHTVLMITHNPRLLARVDRILRIVEGRVVELDRPTAMAALDQAGGRG
jgi:ATP-binding cassette subfamily B protein